MVIACMTEEIGSILFCLTQNFKGFRNMDTEECHAATSNRRE